MLNEIFKTNKCDKHAHQYASLYELLASISEPKSILEIGFMHGASMMSWRQRFLKCNLVALEINTNRPKRLPSQPFQLIEGDFRNYTPKNKFDWIIDDGSHQSQDVRNAFHLFWDYVTPGGWYIIEDLHAGFWKDAFWKDDWIKHVNDLVNNYTHRNGNEAEATKTGFVFQQKSIIAIQKL